jgi:hypothetical protein
VGFAVEPSVGLLRFTALAVGQDVVDFALVGGDVTTGELALAVPDLDGSAEGAGEEPFPHPDIDHFGRGVEHDPFDVGFGQQG